MDYPIDIKEILKCECLPVYPGCTLTTGYWSKYSSTPTTPGGITMDNDIITLDNDTITLDNT